MHKLLVNHRRFLAISLLAEVLIVVVLVLIYAFGPESEYWLYIFISLSGLILIYDFVSALVFNYKVGKAKGQAESTSADILGNDVDEAYNFGLLGLAICDLDGNILWVNSFLEKRFHKVLIDTNAYERFPEFKALVAEGDEKAKKVQVSFENFCYDVEYVPDSRMFIFKDVTDKENALSQYSDLQPVIGYISIDNYSDIRMAMHDDNEFASAIAIVRKDLNDYCEDNGILLRQIKDDYYFIIMTTKDFNQPEVQKFTILDKIREDCSRTAFDESNARGGFTVSIGVAYGFPDYAKLAEEASSALDLALSRGGDQAAIVPFNDTIRFVGGKSQGKTTRNRVKLKERSNSLLKFIGDYDKVLIMGHNAADYDAIGASLGVYVMCKAKGLDEDHVKVFIERDSCDEGTRRAIDNMFTQDELLRMSVNRKRVYSFYDSSTLLIMVDHNSPNLSMFPNIVNDAVSGNRLVIIDHHRPSGQFSIDDNTIFNYIDTTSSSASEIITSFIDFAPFYIHIDARTATFLLAGICLDTHFFKNKSSDLTFDMASLLMSHNADSSKVADYLKDDFAEYSQLTSLVSSARSYRSNVLIIVSPDGQPILDEMLSKAANAALDIREVDLSFAIGRLDKNSIKVSARSNGKINCQYIMEKFHNGGGHLEMAATKIVNTNLTVDQVADELELKLNDYLDEATNSHY